ncbi:MAG: sodium:proton antiporter, partial [Bacteroidales bacterium]|nr:sodium:proton antiporter [Bacteroidales bacterium]
MELLIIVIFVVGYACIALEHPLKINKTATALLLGVLVWTILALSHTMESSIISSELVENLGETAEIVFFLLGAMTIVTLIEDYQGFRVITDRITTTNKKKLLWILSILT